MMSKTNIRALLYAALGRCRLPAGAAFGLRGARLMSLFNPDPVQQPGLYRRSWS